MGFVSTKNTARNIMTINYVRILLIVKQKTAPKGTQKCASTSKPAERVGTSKTVPTNMWEKSIMKNLFSDLTEEVNKLKNKVQNF